MFLRKLSLEESSPKRNRRGQMRALSFGSFSASYLPPGCKHSSRKHSQNLSQMVYYNFRKQYEIQQINTK